MKVAGYVCDYCPDGHDIPEDDVRDEYLCPTCGNKMWYLCSYEIDEETGLTIGENWQDESRMNKTSNKPKPTITCPYCKSTNCKKITNTKKAIKIGLFGIFGAIDDAGKTWGCSECGSKW